MSWVFLPPACPRSTPCLPACLRCRTASNSTIPAATETFRLSTWPRIGIDASQSHRSRTSRRRPVPSAPTTTAVGSVQVDLVVAHRRFAREADRPDAGLLQLLERARDVDDVRDPHVRDRAGRRLGRRAVERRRMPRLPDDARRARRIDRAQDRADVVRILDTVEHDEQAAAPAAAAPSSKIAARRAARCETLACHVGDHPLVHAAARRTIELARPSRPHGNTLARGCLDDGRQPSLRRARRAASRSRARPAALREPG